MTEHTSDTLVIGGGIIGCAIAYRLATRGQRVILLERGAIGREASWAAAGIIEHGSFARSDPLARLRQASSALYPLWIDELRGHTDVDPQYLVSGSLELITDSNQESATQREIHAAAGRHDSCGRPLVERLTIQQALAAAPILSSESQSIAPELRGARWVGCVGHVRSPRLMQALLAACRRAGVQLHTDIAVSEIEVHAGRVTRIHTSAGAFDSGAFVLAGGAWSSGLHPDLPRVIPVHPIRGQMVQLTAGNSADAGTPQAFNPIIGHGEKYAICRKDGRMLIGSTREPQAGFENRVTAGGIAALLRFMERFLPGLRHATFEMAWSGLRPGTRDGRPYLGHIPGFERLFAATGHAYAGITLAPATAELLAELICTGRSATDLTPFAPGRTLPTEPMSDEIP